MDKTNKELEKDYLKYKDKLANIILVARKKKGLSLVQLSEKTKLSPSYINRLEKGERKVSFDILIKLADALDLDQIGLLESVRNESNENTDLADILLRTELSHKGEVLKSEGKLLLYEVIKEIIECKWSEKSMIADISKIMTLIDKFKKA